MESDGCEGVGNMLEWVNRSAGGAHRRGRRSGRDETIAEKHEDTDTHVACATEPSAPGRRRANGECPEYHGTEVPRDPHDDRTAMRIIYHDTHALTNDQPPEWARRAYDIH